MNPTARSKTPARPARTARRIEVAVTSPVDADLSGRDWFSTPTAAASFAVVKATTSAEFRGVDQVMVTMTYDNTDAPGLDDVCLAGTPGEITCALAAMPVYAAGVRKALVPSTEYVRDAVDEVAGPIQWRLLDEDAVIDVRVHSIRPDPLPNSQYSLSRFTEPVARDLADDLARSITAHSDGGRSQATVTYLAEQDRIFIEHHVEISATDTAAVKRYTRITQLRANLAVLDPVTETETAAQLSTELQTLDAPTQRPPVQSATPGRGTTTRATQPTGGNTR